MYAGRLNPEKNVPLLLQAFHDMMRTVPDAALWVAGLGDQRVQLEATCQSLGIAHRVHFLGFVVHDELARHYVACDVFVLPSLVEIQPIVAMEAMHFARPVIVTRAIVSAQELVDDGVNGYIVDATQPAELTSRLIQLAGDANLRHRLGLAGRERSVNFAPEGVLSALVAAYDGLEHSTS